MIKIRPARLEDAPQILEIYAWYVKNTAITFEWEVPDLPEFEGRMRHTMKRYPYLVAEEEGRILGFAYTGPFKGRKAYDWSVETSIYVRQDRRRDGLGRRLYEALEDASRQQHILNLYACISRPVQEDAYLDAGSIRFHERMGYRLCGTFQRCGYKFDRWYDMVWMEKMLGDHDGKPEPVIPHPDTCAK